MRATSGIISLRRGWPFGRLVAAWASVELANAADASAAAAERSRGLNAPASAVTLAPMNVDYASPTDAPLQAAVTRIDVALRMELGMADDSTAVGVLDLRTGRLALVRPDAITYGASVPKIGILLAWFHDHPGKAESIDAETRRELGEMIKRSSNEMASKFSRPLGIARIQTILSDGGFYDAQRGGGIWFGKHYGQDSERVRDPVGSHSHAATVRQLVRFYLQLEQGRLISPAASRAMREIFASPEIPHIADRFVKGLAGRGLELRRKSGWWETWSHDSAVVTGPGRHYILVALTHHARGTDYLEQLAAAVDDELTAAAPRN